ncbi:MAG TPA: FAD-dependent monooxygenase, partial [Longimicrobiales bacterium]|nr:FAD-dependent monooxygenase [Longimicrobiales bacterium]
MSGRSIDTHIAVVGAGPAGARAAELLATAGADVLLLDPRAPWEKPCGGGLTLSTFRDVPELEDLAPLMRAVGRIRVEASAERG